MWMHLKARVFFSSRVANEGEWERKEKKEEDKGDRKKASEWIGGATLGVWIT